MGKAGVRFLELGLLGWNWLFFGVIVWVLKFRCLISCSDYRRLLFFYLYLTIGLLLYKVDIL